MSIGRLVPFAAAVCAAACAVARANDAEIIVAARAGDLQRLERLAGTASAALAERDAKGQTPLMAAAGALQPKAVDLLIALHSDVNAKDGRRMTALTVAIASPLASKTSERDRAEIVAALMKSGADASAADADGMTALHWLALRGRTGLLSLIPMGSGDVRAKDRAGRTPLHYAAMSNDASVLEALIRAGADVSASDALGETALHTAARRFRPEATAVLLEHEAKVDSLSKKRETPLLLLAMESNDSPEVDAALVRTAEVLIAHGANVNAPDADGVTPTRAAVLHEHPKLAELLRKHGGAA